MTRVEHDEGHGIAPEVAAHVAIGLDRAGVEALLGPVDGATWDAAVALASAPRPPPVDYIAGFGALAALEASLASASPGVAAGAPHAVPFAEPCAGALGLDYHLVLACAGRDQARCVHAVTRVGIERAWAGLGVVASTCHVPAGQPADEALRFLASSGKVPWWLDVRVARSWQATNPLAMFELRGGMDWCAWPELASRAVRHASRLDATPQWRRRKAIEHAGAGLLDPRAHASFSAARAGDWDRCDIAGTRGPSTWEPRVAPAGRLSDGTARCTVVIGNPTQKQERKAFALACAFPLATVLEGECTWHGAAGAARAERAVAIDATVPSNGQPLLVDAVATLVLSSVQEDPSRVAIVAGGPGLPVAFPPGYPADPSALFAGKRAPAVDGKVLSLAAQWARQRQLNKG